MDKNLLKKFAIEARKDLTDKIRNKIKTFFIDEVFSKEQKGEIYVLSNEKYSLSLTIDEYKKRELLIKRIKELSLDQVIEESAYTWFNRIIAIRYMEINNILPLTKNNQSLGIRVLSSKDNLSDPEILKFSNLTHPDLDINLNKKKYVELKTDNEKFKYILLLICTKLGNVIPQVFSGMTDYIDILIPDNLLNDTGFISRLIKEVPENSYKKVEIIGWLYQYYNQSEKDRVIAAKKVYKKTEIPYATQLFTPDWIVKYMVENSLGRYWLEHSNNEKMKKNWKYYIDNDVNVKESIIPTDIKFIDPCCGSGHVLVYAFEILYQIYESVGYNKIDIPELILKNNLYGLDIDDRAGQLSILSVLLKAREYDKNIFNKDIVRNLNVMSIQESSNINEFILEGLPEQLKDSAIYLKDMFKNAKEIGSLLLLKDYDYNDLIYYINNQITIETEMLKTYMLPIIKIANILSKKYDIVVTNPPYMNNSVMSINLKKYIQNHYKDVKGDLFSAFIIRNCKFGNEKSHLGFMTPYVWMFISTYQNLRKYILENVNISSLIQFEYSALEEATVPICSFILNNNDENGYYFRLTHFKGGMSVQEKKFLEMKDKKNYIQLHKNIFKNIPEYKIVYWLSSDMLNKFNGKRLSDLCQLKQGLSTANNNRFIRFWYEVELSNFALNISSRNEAINSQKKWFPLNKGGDYRKWYGNNYFVINWFNDGEELKKYNGAAIRNSEYYFKSSLTWTLISSSNFGARYSPKGFIFEAGGSSLFVKNNMNIFLGYMCSKVAKMYLDAINPTLNFSNGVVGKLPFVEINNSKLINQIDDIVNNCINISKTDWDSFETSWDFKIHPLLINYTLDKEKKYLRQIYNSWEKTCHERFYKLKQNETDLNNIFIDIFKLQNELIPEVNDKDITLKKADKIREIKSLISYAVGCMFGRYSLDESGIIFAGGEFNIDKYKTFKADNDNIILITEEAYISDDIVDKFKQFLEIAYGNDTLSENLEFIAEVLGKKNSETSEDAIRRYFNNEFYYDHIKTYQKKPIYWLFDSGKKNGFKCLVYMHRYSTNLVPKIRLDYLHRMQTVYEKLLTDLKYKISIVSSINEKKELQKKNIDLNSKLQEIKEYDEKIAHISNQRISINLDDGVTVNYSKFADILAKIK